MVFMVWRRKFCFCVCFALVNRGIHQGAPLKDMLCHRHVLGRPRRCHGPLRLAARPLAVGPLPVASRADTWRTDADVPSGCLPARWTHIMQVICSGWCRIIWMSWRLGRDAPRYMGPIEGLSGCCGVCLRGVGRLARPCDFSPGGVGCCRVQLSSGLTCCSACWAVLAPWWSSRMSNAVGPNAPTAAMQPWPVAWEMCNGLVEELLNFRGRVVLRLVDSGADTLLRSPDHMCNDTGKIGIALAQG